MPEHVNIRVYSSMCLLLRTRSLAAMGETLILICLESSAHVQTRQMQRWIGAGHYPGQS